MKFPELYQRYWRRGEPVVSFELFPPKTAEGMNKLEERLPRLIALEPAYVTVTYGAMGTTRERTLELVSRIRNQYGMECAHHLTCVGHSRREIDGLLGEIQRHGIENIVALRGDPPQGEAAFRRPEGGFAHASELVRHIRSDWDFGVAVAGYPEKHVDSPDLDTDLLYLKHKVDQGADVVITQLFYDNAQFYNFLRRCRLMEMTLPLVPGLLPILNVAQIKKITQLCGAQIPRELLERLHECDDRSERVCQVGIEHTVEQASELLRQGAPGLHFYVLNQFFHIAEIMEALKPVIREVRERRRLAAGGPAGQNVPE